MHCCSCSPCLCCMQVAPATQSSRVGAQQTHQQLQPQIGTTSLPGIAPGPQPASQVAIGNIQGPEDLSSRSVCPVPCQSSFGHPAHSPERDHKPQAKRLRQQDPSPAPNVLLGVAGVSLALHLVPPIHCAVLSQPGSLSAMRSELVSCICVLQSRNNVIAMMLVHSVAHHQS